jgi:anti-sigma factor RsiW
VTRVECDRIRDLLALHVDGALEAAEEEAVRGHLAACEACRREERLERASLAAFEALGSAEVPAGFAERVAAAARPRRSALRWIPAAAGLAAVAIAGAIWIAGPGGETSEDGEVIAHLDLLENWDLVTDEEVALVLDVPEEEIGLLQGTLGG